MKLQQIKDSSFFVTIPMQLVLAKGWKKGDTLKASIDEKGNLVIKR